MGTGGDARLEGDPPGVATHHLDDDHPAVRRRRGEQPVDALRGEAHRRVEAERLDRLVEVVVDRLRHADDAQAGLVETLGDVQRAVAADRHEGVDVADGEQLDELVGAIDLDVASRRAGAPGTPSGCLDWWCRGSCRRGGRCRAPPRVAAARCRRRGSAPGYSSPLKPSRMPTTSQSRLRPASTTARITALSPGASPPPVDTAMRLIGRAGSSIGPAVRRPATHCCRNTGDPDFRMGRSARIGTMFDLDEFLDQCRQARHESEPRLAVRDVVHGRSPSPRRSPTRCGRSEPGSPCCTRPTTSPC